MSHLSTALAMFQAFVSLHVHLLQMAARSRQTGAVRDQGLPLLHTLLALPLLLPYARHGLLLRPRWALRLVKGQMRCSGRSVMAAWRREARVGPLSLAGVAVAVEDTACRVRLVPFPPCAQ